MLSEILEQAASFNERCRSNASTAWFRGHASADWKLKSTLHRHCEHYLNTVGSAAASDLDPNELLRMEYGSLYHQFRNDAWPLLKEVERSEWGLIFTMQHFGFPTRLLDWTQSFVCALYFAHRDRSPEQSAAVWGLNPEALNKLALGEQQLAALDDHNGPSNFPSRAWHPHYLPHEGESLASVAVIPYLTNARMNAQRAAFTMMGDSFASLDQEFNGELLRRGALIKIELAPATHAETDAFLTLCGCSAFTYFPDLEGLAQRHKADVREQLRWVKKA